MDPATLRLADEDVTLIEVGDRYTQLDGDHGVVADAVGALSVKAGVIVTEGHQAHGVATRGVRIGARYRF